MAGRVGAQSVPGATVPGTAATTTTTAPPATSSTVATVPATTPTPATPPPPASLPAGNETKLLPVGPDTKAGDPARPGAVTPPTTKPGDPPAAPAVPPPSLSHGQVDEVLRNLQRSGASSTGALIEALRPLQNVGMTTQEALALGMGQFPLLGLTNWTDDWLDPRAGPPPHQHQGTDLFAPFDTPVRAPVDGTVRFEDAGLGGKGIFVTTADGTYYYMAHLNGFNPDLVSGAAVKQGQIVGYNGDSGNARGGAPHVHFEVHPRGGAAVNPKPILDGWVADALARAPALVASYQPQPVAASPEAGGDDGGVPQILVATGLTRRFSTPALPVPGRERPTTDFNRAVLVPLTPAVLAPLLDGTQTDR